MASSSKNPVTGAPVFGDQDAPDPAVNPTEVAAYAAKVGTRLIGTTAERDGYDYAREGLRWYNTTTKSEDLHDGTGWRAVGTPYAMASGSGSNGAGATATITFPAGRFSQPPNITGSTTGGLVRVFQVISRTSTSAVVGGFDLGGNAVAASWTWVAVQMTPSAANG